jgi:uncharacterized protein (DUF1330 family)
MAAYLIFTKDKVTDQSELDIYNGVAGGTLAGHEVKVHTFYGPSETLEGTPTQGVVTLEFPTMDAARAWYHSKAYQDAAAHRKRGAEYRVILTEGVPPAA